MLENTKNKLSRLFNQMKRAFKATITALIVTVIAGIFLVFLRMILKFTFFNPLPGIAILYFSISLLLILIDDYVEDYLIKNKKK